MATKITDIIDFTGTDNEFNPYPQMDSRYGPYESISSALLSLSTVKRCVGLTIGIKDRNSITEYWFKDGILDSDLVEKSEDSYQYYKSKGGQKLRDDYYNTLKEIVDTSAYVILHSNVDNVKLEVTVSKEPFVLGSSSTSSYTDSSTSTSPSNQLAYLHISTKDIDTSLPEDSRTVNVNISNGGGNRTFILGKDGINYSYSGIGGSRDCKVTISFPTTTFENIIGIYNSNTGELLSNSQIYEFNTPINGSSYITIKFKNN